MAENRNVQVSLYQRLGGYDVIAAIVDEVLARMREDPKFARFGTRSADSRNRGRQLLVDQMCALAGGPCVYIGRDMKTAHAGFGITEEEWEASLRHTRDALVRQRIGEHEQRDFLELFERYKADIVEAEASPLHRAGAQ